MSSVKSKGSLFFPVTFCQPSHHVFTGVRVVNHSYSTDHTVPMPVSTMLSFSKPCHSAPKYLLLSPMEKKKRNKLFEAVTHLSPNTCFTASEMPHCLPWKPSWKPVLLVPPPSTGPLRVPGSQSTEGPCLGTHPALLKQAA